MESTKIKRLTYGGLEGLRAYHIDPTDEAAETSEASPRQFSLDNDWKNKYSICDYEKMLFVILGEGVSQSKGTKPISIEAMKSVRKRQRLGNGIDVVDS